MLGKLPVGLEADKTNLTLTMLSVFSCHLGRMEGPMWEDGGRNERMGGTVLKILLLD